ncbi:MAG TPA: hypothetical protein VK433_04840 [Stellaceae bacterium]|nr:hypothetical protein [Stellaceae bacterium]
MIGGSLFYDFARVGATPAPFQSFVLSAGVVTDYVYGAGVHWQGGCGGFPCDGSESLIEWNVIGELKAATPLGGGDALNGYIGAGAAIFWPSGHPTGGTTSFLGSATAPGAEFETTSERFRFDHKNEGKTAVIWGTADARRKCSGRRPVTHSRPAAERRVAASTTHLFQSLATYSITSSAPSKIARGTSIPSAFAVLRLRAM